MTKPRFLAAFLMLGAALVWIAVREPQHPDTSGLPSFTAYAAIGGDLSPSWSGDDRSLIYCTLAGGSPQLYTIPADGGAPMPFESGVSEGCLPAWSRDGTRVAFTSKEREKFQLMSFLGLADPINVWTANASGKARQVTDELAALLDPAWSPDGGRIAFTAFPGLAS